METKGQEFEPSMLFCTFIDWCTHRFTEDAPFNRCDNEVVNDMSTLIAIEFSSLRVGRNNIPLRVIGPSRGLDSPSINILRVPRLFRPTMARDVALESNFNGLIRWRLIKFVVFWLKMVLGGGWLTIYKIWFC